MARVADGDARAFTALVGELYGPALRLAVRTTGDCGEAEDALQTALTRLWTEARRFDPARGSVGGWFRRIVVNACLDRRRRLRIVAPIEAAAHVASDLPTPYEASAANERARRLAVAMAALNPASGRRSPCFTERARRWLRLPARSKRRRRRSRDCSPGRVLNWYDRLLATARRETNDRDTVLFPHRRNHRRLWR